eukprot:TRINITY_DN23086_c1_g1_i19.p1 TRINITY_DN23086_c1_g1~~TRINITY_DN23086_c1_g1_i19.p1  ORF type:complete len:256 (-),score=28.13 TRINITY_DN23086_c1_g1_i19:99-866(-)
MSVPSPKNAGRPSKAPARNSAPPNTIPCPSRPQAPLGDRPTDKRSPSRITPGSLTPELRRTTRSYEPTDAPSSPEPTTVGSQAPGATARLASLMPMKQVPPSTNTKPSIAASRSLAGFEDCNSLPAASNRRMARSATPPEVASTVNVLPAAASNWQRSTSRTPNPPSPRKALKLTVPCDGSISRAVVSVSFSSNGPKMSFSSTKSRDQPSRLPTSLPFVSRITSCHTPWAELLSQTSSDSCGRQVPVKGASAATQ